MRCLNCHYSLRSLRGPEYRCPECGRAFNPSDPITFDVARKSRGPALLWPLVLIGSTFVVRVVVGRFMWPEEYRLLDLMDAFWFTLFVAPVIWLLYLLVLALVQSRLP